MSCITYAITSVPAHEMENYKPCLMNATNSHFCNCGMASLVPRKNTRTKRSSSATRKRK